jgi:O-antigen/teichoic acid export membrane protein
VEYLNIDLSFLINFITFFVNLFKQYVLVKDFWLGFGGVIVIGIPIVIVIYFVLRKRQKRPARQQSLPQVKYDNDPIIIDETKD